MAVCGLANNSTCAADDIPHSVMDKHADITTMCGTKPVVVGHVDGFGGATWFKTAAAEFKDELSKCPNVKKVTYLDANNDSQEIQQRHQQPRFARREYHCGVHEFRSGLPSGIQGGYQSWRDDGAVLL